MTHFSLKISLKKFHCLIFNWFDRHGRKNLPWQYNKNPYRVWISEIMLQQTQVSTVIPYFLRFIEHFPDIQALSRASEDEVLHYWTGLGYYSRARNLYKSAKIIVDMHQGKFPDTLETLETLPGIGRSTAGAILSIAFEKKATILDGNVKRVLTRLFCIKKWPGEKSVAQTLWSLAEKYTPEKRTADYSQAMMDIGATICVRGKPYCDKCPLEKICIAHKEQIEKTLPQSKPRSILPIRKTTFFIFQNNNNILLEKRPTKGIWGGLWSLPEISEHLSLQDIRTYCEKRLKYEIDHINIQQPFRHSFTHFHLDILPVLIKINKISSKLMEEPQQIWYKLHNPDTVGLPAPIKKILGTLI